MASGDSPQKSQGVFERLDKLNEFERQPVTADKLHGGRYFAGLFAGEHVAATEFVIGALFVIWGARVYDVVVGLLIGNLLAVLSWTLICAPIAVRTRLTLYWYLRQIAGPVVTVLYNLLNAVLYCILAGCMITVAASAVRIPFGIAPQTGWFPEDTAFVFVVIGVGAVVVTLAILGFKRLAQFAVVCSPWMLLMFLCGAIMAMPEVGHVSNLKNFWSVAESRIWSGPGPAVSRVETRAAEDGKGKEVVLHLTNLGDRLLVLSEGESAHASYETDPTRAELPGFFLSSDKDPKTAAFVEAKARVENVYGEDTSGMKMDPSFAAEAQALTAQAEQTRRRAAGQSGGENGTEEVAEPATASEDEGAAAENAAETAPAPAPQSPPLPPFVPQSPDIPPPPPVLERIVVLRAEGVTDPQLIRYARPKTRIGAICNDNYVPLQDFTADIQGTILSAVTHIGFWHIAAFAWICNLAMHIGLSDMAIFRFAKSSWYGLYSSLGMFLGHYLAWMCAGIMGAAAARLTATPLMMLDSGQVAFLSLGWAGAIAVIIAGWTTSNPTLYRAGLALQVITPNWPRWLVTLLAGIITTAIACFPFVFLYLLDFVGVYGILLMPVGAIVVVEHWIFPLLGWQQYWSSKRGQLVNVPAVLAWAAGLALALVGWQMGWIHLFFLAVPVWFLTALVYLIAAFMAGASKHVEKDGEAHASQAGAPSIEPTPAAGRSPSGGRPTGLLTFAFGFGAALCLLASLGFAIICFLGYMEPATIKPSLLYLAIVYFVLGTLYVVNRERARASNG